MDTGSTLDGALWIFRRVLIMLQLFGEDSWKKMGRALWRVQQEGFMKRFSFIGKGVCV